jgi:Tautomerase enzyme
MPLFTVTMESNRSTSEKDRLSRAIHAASIAAGYPEDDLFQRFLSLGPSDFRVDLYYPALPKPRTEQMLLIEVLVSSGTDTNRKRGLVAALVEKLGEAGIDPNDIMVFFLETDRASGSFGGGRFAQPVAVACSLPIASSLHGVEEAGDVREKRFEACCNRSVNCSWQPGCALMEMKELDPRDNERRNV